MFALKSFGGKPLHMKGLETKGRNIYSELNNHGKLHKDCIFRFGFRSIFNNRSVSNEFESQFEEGRLFVGGIQDLGNLGGTSGHQKDNIGGEAPNILLSLPSTPPKIPGPGRPTQTGLLSYNCFSNWLRR